MSHHQSASPPRGRTRPPPPVPSPRAGRSHHRRGPQAGYLVLNDDSTSHLARMFAPDSRGHSCKPSARAPRFCGSFGPGRAARMRSWATLHRRRARSGGRRPPLQPPAPPRPSSPAPSTAVRLTPALPSPARPGPAPTAGEWESRGTASATSSLDPRERPSAGRRSGKGATPRGRRGSARDAIQKSRPDFRAAGPPLQGQGSRSRRRETEATRWLCARPPVPRSEPRRVDRCQSRTLQLTRW